MQLQLFSLFAIAAAAFLSKNFFSKIS